MVPAPKAGEKESSIEMFAEANSIQSSKVCFDFILYKNLSLHRLFDDDKPVAFDIKAEYSDCAIELGAPAGIGKDIGPFPSKG